MFTVHAKKPRRFNTLEAAREYANAYLRARGVFVAITFSK